jgi:MFS family permease
MSLSRPLILLIARLGLTQIIGYGTLYYAFAVIQPQIVATTGWSQSFVFSGVSLSVLFGGLVAARIGRAVDRLGGRRVMSLGSAVGALGLALLAMASTPAIYIAAWLLIGVASRMALYEVAFAVLAQADPARARDTITTMTLIGGFASTVFWPITQWLEIWLGWRDATLVLAAINLLVALPLHLMLPGKTTGRAGLPKAEDVEGLTSPRGLPFMLLGLVLALYGFCFYALSVHGVAMLERKGLSATEAVLVAAAIGPSQVAGRIGEMLVGRRFPAMVTGLVAAFLLPVGLVIFGLTSSTGWLLAFAVFYGMANGLFTIVRGTVPLALFGSRGYGETQGRLAQLTLATSAAAPFAVAALVDWKGDALAVQVMIGLSAVALAGMVLLFVVTERLRRAGPPA